MRSWPPGRSPPPWPSGASPWPTSACWPPARPRATCWFPASPPWSTDAWAAGRWRHCLPVGCAARAWPPSRRRPPRCALASTWWPWRSAPSWSAAASRPAATPVPSPASTPSSCAGCCRTAPARSCSRASPGPPARRCGSTGSTWPPTPMSTRPACTPAPASRGRRRPAEPGSTSRPSPPPRRPGCCACARTPGPCPAWSSSGWPSWPGSPCADWSTRPGSTTCCATTAPSTSAPRSTGCSRRPAWPSPGSAGSPTCPPGATPARRASSSCSRSAGGRAGSGPERPRPARAAVTAVPGAPPATSSPLGEPAADDGEVARWLLLQLALVWADFEQRLRSVELARRIEQGEVTLGEYRRLLVNLRQQVVDGGRWIARAASSMSAELFGLRSAFILHAGEEHRDFQLLEQDYLAVGGSLEEIQQAPKNVGSEALSAFIFHQAGQPDPVDLLGAMFVIEGLGAAKALRWAELLQARLGLDDDQVRFLRYHGANDDDHFELLRQVLRSPVVDRPAAERIVKTAKVVARLYALQLEELDHA